MAKSEIKMPLPKLDDLFTTEQERQEANLEKVVDISIADIQDFPNHPFKVIVNEELNDMADSIKKDGVQEPALVRPLANGKYQMISGHRRKNGKRFFRLSRIHREFCSRDKNSDCCIIFDF